MELPLIARANEHVKRTAIIDRDSHYTYRHLLDESAKVAAYLLRTGDEDSLDGKRVALMMLPGFGYVATLWGIWRAGGMAVPLGISHPATVLSYTMSDAQVAMVVAETLFLPTIEPMAKEMAIACLSYEEISTKDHYIELPVVSVAAGALLLYTSGTTSQPKGVAISHSNLQAQMEILCEAWQWSADDHVLHVLPLYHVHGIVNVLLCPLWSGAICEFMLKFEPALAWEHFCHGSINVFMAVPTIYAKLAAYWNEAPDTLQMQMSKGLQRFRLMVSGSAALPVSLFKQWRNISGQTLLERYGMTEIGMALSNPYVGTRLAGFVGAPLPSVQIRLVDEQGRVVVAGQQGEIQVKGPSVFSGYWNNAEATKQAFTADGWFKTGDLAIIEKGNYRILGRISVDIIKSGGYKISALEIEEVLRMQPQIQECAVVGLPNDEWGEVVAALLVATEGEGQLSESSLREWAKKILPSYKVPRRFIYATELPRNAMGKVTKQEVKILLMQYSMEGGQ